MTRADLKDEVIVVLENGEKRWKHLEVIYQIDPNNQQKVRNALADLMEEGKVRVGLDPTNRNPIYALASRL